MSKKILLALTLLTLSFTLYGCNSNSSTADEGSQNVAHNKDTTTNTNPSDSTAPTQDNAKTSTTEVKISRDRAIEIASTHANIDETLATYDRVDLDYENGHPYYEVEFRLNNQEYDYEINANTGEIMSTERDSNGNFIPYDNSITTSENNRVENDNATITNTDPPETQPIPVE